MRAESDPALETLMLPLAEGRLAWPGDGALFLRARDGWPLHAAPRPGHEPGIAAFFPDRTSEDKSLNRYGNLE